MTYLKKKVKRKVAFKHMINDTFFNQKYVFYLSLKIMISKNLFLGVLES